MNYMGSLGMLAVSKGGEWLLGKAVSSVQNKVEKLSFDTLVKFLSGVPQGEDQDLVKDHPDYRGRTHFDWEQTKAGDGGFWHRGRFVDGEQLNDMLKAQQLNPTAEHPKITLADFKRMMDALPKDGGKAANKGFLRLIRDGEKVVLDKVGSWGLGDKFICFRCNLDDEHNRQVRALFVDAMLEDMRGMFPSLQSGSEAVGAETLLAKGKITEEMDAVYTELGKLLSAEKTAVKGGKGTKAVMAQKLEREKVDDLIRRYEKIFDAAKLGPVFEALIADACDVIGLRDAPGKTKVETFREVFGDKLKNRIGVDYETLLNDLVASKSGKKVGESIRAMADALEGICREEVLNQAIAGVKENADGVRFQSGSREYRALQAQLRDEARTIVGGMSGAKPKDVPEVLAERFMQEVLPYMLEKCRTDPKYRAAFSLETVKRDLADFIQDLSRIRSGNFSKGVSNFKIIEAVVEAEYRNAEIEYGKVGARLAELERQGRKNDDPEVVTLHVRQLDLQTDLQRLAENRSIVRALEAGDDSALASGSRVGRWLSALDPKQRAELGEHLRQGFVGKNETVYARWLENHWAQEKYQVKLPLAPDFLALYKDEAELFTQKAVQALAVNAARQGETPLQEIITQLGDLLMDKSFAENASKKLKAYGEQKQEVEGRDLQKGPASEPEKDRKLDLVSGLIESFVKATIAQRVGPRGTLLQRDAQWFERRAKFIEERLGRVCGELMSTWGSSILASFSRSLNAYFNQGQLRLQEVQDQMAAFKRDLGKEIGEKLFASFAADLKDIVMLEDDKAFQKALNGRLDEYVQRTQKACLDKANAVVYGMLGFTFGAAPDKTGDAPRFEGADRVGQGFAEINQKLSDTRLYAGESNVLSADELQTAFTKVGQGVWMNLVVGNAPGRGNIFTEFISSTAKTLKLKVKAMLMGQVEKYEKEIPEFFRKLVGYEDFKLVKSVKGGLSENLASGKIDEAWVGKVQKQFAAEMTERLERYKAYEREYLAAFDRQLAERLKNLDDERLADLDGDALAALAQDVRRRLAGNAVKDALKKALALSASGGDALALDLAVKQALDTLSNPDIAAAVSQIAGTKRQELEAAFKADADRVVRTENKLAGLVRTALGYQGQSVDQIQDNRYHALVQKNGFMRNFAEWSKGRVQADLLRNPLLAYKYDGNSADDIIARAYDGLLRAFEQGLPDLVARVDAYVAAFPPEHRGASKLGLFALLGPEAKTLNVVNATQASVESCFATLSEKLDKRAKTDPARVQRIHADVDAALEKLTKTLDASVKAWSGAGPTRLDNWQAQLTRQLQSTAKRVAGRAVDTVMKGVAWDDAEAEKNIAAAVKEAVDALQLAYDGEAGRYFQHFTEVSKEIKSYGEGGASREELLKEIQAELKSVDGTGFLGGANESATEYEGMRRWFAEACLKRALDFVLKNDCTNIVALSDECRDAKDWKDRLKQIVRGNVVDLLQKEGVALGNGFHRVLNAYYDALKAHQEIKSVHGRAETPTGNLEQAFKDLLDCRLPSNPDAAKTVDQVVQAYEHNVQAASLSALGELTAGFKRAYVDIRGQSFEALKRAVDVYALPAELLDLYAEHCDKMYVELTSWACSQVINGADVAKMTDELSQYLKYDLESVQHLFLQFAVDSGLLSEAEVAKRLNLSPQGPEMQRLRQDAPFRHLVGAVQKKAFKNILAGLESALSHQLKFDAGILDLLSEKAIERAGGGLSAEDAKKLEARRDFVRKSLSAGSPQRTVGPDEKDAVWGKLMGLDAAITKAYRDFHAKHPDLVDLALQQKKPVSGKPSLFTQFYGLMKARNGGRLMGNGVGLSLEELLKLHAKVVKKSSPSSARLHELWLHYEDRRSDVMGFGKGQTALEMDDDGNYQLAATVAEIDSLHSDIMTEPDDFLGDVVLTHDGHPKPELAALVQTVAEEILKEVKK